MANEEQLSILKQGVEVWNKWRKENPDVEIDLSDPDLIEVGLIEADLRGVDFSRAYLIGTNLTRANLSGATLREADLSMADLREANLSYANLFDADLKRAILMKANLKNAKFGEADLREAHLQDTNLGGAELWGTNLWGAFLGGANFLKAMTLETIFGNSDLSNVKELENVIHLGPSSLSASTYALSNGKIPEAFLRGCGLSDWEIETVKLYNPELNNNEVNKILYRIYDLRATHALQISPLFISYCHGDEKFVDKLESQLNKKGIRFWRDIHDMKAGRIETQIDKAISQNRTVLLVLSEHSIKSDWVEHEVRTARGLEKDMGRDVLCPVALDDSWKSSPWPKRVMEQIMEYNVLDFSAWEDDVKFEGMFRKLVGGLELFYKDKSHGE